MIHVCFGLHDKTGRYSKFTGTAMLSIFDNHMPPCQPSITVHILHDNTLSPDNRDKFSYIAGRYGQTVKFYNVEELCADKVNKMIELVPAVKTSRVSVGAFYRLLIPQVLPADIDRCIYLDSDMIVNLDIKELWQIDLGDKPLAAVREMEANAYNYKTVDAKNKYLLNAGFANYDDYFNSGLIVMNLNYLRQSEELIMSGVKWRGEHPQCDCFDQDIWNYLFSKNYTRLPVKFDSFVCNERSQGRITQTAPKIYHCTSPTLLLDMSDPYNRMWMDYFIRTPFFDAAAIGRLYTGFKKNYSQLSAGKKTSMIQLSAMMSGKIRAFFAAPADFDTVRRIFFVRPDEELIPAENAESLKKLLDAMHTARGQKIFFVMLPKFPFQILTKAGFIPGRDFLNGVEFLPDKKDASLDSYELIKAM